MTGRTERSPCGRSFRSPRGLHSSESPASAAIRLSPDERFLYVSTRFADVITVFELGASARDSSRGPCSSSGGLHPRDIVLTPGGEFLLAANRTDGGLASFAGIPRAGGPQAPYRASRPPRRSPSRWNHDFWELSHFL